MPYEAKIEWTGWQGGPGYSTFHFASSVGTVDAIATALESFIEAIANLVPASITLQVMPQWRRLDDASGALIAEGTFGTGTTPHIGTGNAAFASVAGMCINWLTGASAGRKLRVGRTFLVPLTAFIWGTDGTVNDSVVSQLQTDAQNLADDSTVSLVVWKRPVGGAGGVATPVTGVRVPDEAVVLRSRRR